MAERAERAPRVRWLPVENTDGGGEARGPTASPREGNRAREPSSGDLIGQLGSEATVAIGDAAINTAGVLADAAADISQQLSATVNETMDKTKELLNVETARKLKSDLDQSVIDHGVITGTAFTAGKAAMDLGRGSVGVAAGAAFGTGRAVSNAAFGTGRAVTGALFSTSVGSMVEGALDSTSRMLAGSAAVRAAADKAELLSSQLGIDSYILEGKLLLDGGIASASRGSVVPALPSNKKTLVDLASKKVFKAIMVQGTKLQAVKFEVSRAGVSFFDGASLLEAFPFYSTAAGVAGVALWEYHPKTQYLVVTAKPAKGSDAKPRELNLKMGRDSAMAAANAMTEHAKAIFSERKRLKMEHAAAMDEYEAVKAAYEAECNTAAEEELRQRAKSTPPRSKAHKAKGAGAQVIDSPMRAVAVPVAPDSVESFMAKRGQTKLHNLHRQPGAAHPPVAAAAALAAAAPTVEAGTALRGVGKPRKSKGLASGKGKVKTEGKAAGKGNAKGKSNGKSKGKSIGKSKGKAKGKAKSKKVRKEEDEEEAEGGWGTGTLLCCGCMLAPAFLAPAAILLLQQMQGGGGGGGVVAAKAEPA